MPLVHYNLSVNDPRKLEQQLAAGEYLEDLQILQGGQYLHMMILQSYLHCEHALVRKLWSSCLDKLIELKAPLEHGVSCVATAFIEELQWVHDAQSTLAMAQKYMDAGYMAVDRPLRGTLPFQQDVKRTVSGKLPLAAAIGLDTPVAVRFLLDNGASLNIGPQFVGDPDRSALEFAQDTGSFSCASEIIRFLMERRFDAASGGSPRDPDERPRTSLRASM